MRWMLEGGLLSPDEVERVIDHALSLLENPGIQVENAWIVERLAAAGALERGGAVCLRRAWMRDFLAASDRVSWEGRTVFFGGTAEIYQGWYLNPQNGAYEPWTLDTLLRYAGLAQSLPDIGQASLLGMPALDGPQGPQPLTEKLVAWKWGLHGGTAIWDTALCPAILRMWEAWGEAAGQDPKGLFTGTVYLVSPMKFAREEAAQFAFFAQRGYEVSVGSLGSLGGTTPVTPAGALALQLAEGLFLQVLRRVFFGHSDLALGNSLSVIDMGTGAFQYGRPEQVLLNLAGAQVAKALGAGYGPHGGLSDARSPGYESAWQKAVSTLANAMTSGYGHMAAGLLAVDEVFSPEQLLLDHEALGYLGRLSRGFSCEEEDFALETIRDAGWGGQYLDQEHTFEHFRGQLWFPTLFSTQSYGMWRAAGAPDARERVRQRAVSAMEEASPPQPRMEPRTEERLRQIIAHPI